MQIDWITVAAQAVNFLVLVWLLHRFLYGPIVRAMDRREQRIADRLREAEAMRADAESEAQSYRDRREALEADGERLRAEAREAAEAERRSLERAAREEIEESRREWVKQLEAERETFLRDLRGRATEHFYALARRALGDLANAEIEEQMANIFIDRLEHLDRETRRKLAHGCREAGDTAIVRSRFELPTGTRRNITRAMHEQIADGVEVAYEESEDAACGIELKAGGQRLAWSLDGYFDALEETLREELAAEATLPEEAEG